jgi:hypothetical protein
MIGGLHLHAHRREPRRADGVAEEEQESERCHLHRPPPRAPVSGGPRRPTH